MKNKKIVIRILLILISILCILLPTKVSAMSQEEAGETIAKYAVNFYNNEEKRNLVIYYGGDDLYTSRYLSISFVSSLLSNSSVISFKYVSSYQLIVPSPSIV